MPDLMRFGQTDPKVDEGQHSFTPYHYSFNNPIRFSDPDGLMGESCCGDGADGIGNGMTLVENIYYSTRDALVSSITTVSTALGSLFNDNIKPQRVNATYSSGSRILSAETIPKGEVVKEVAVSTLVLATAVPSGGNAGTSMLMAKAGTKTTAASSVATTVKGSRAGKAFTPAEKAKVLEANAAKNNGEIICEGCGVTTTKPAKSQRGVTPPKTDRQIDHKEPKSKGGSGTAENGQVLCRDCNRKKSDS